MAVVGPLAIGPQRKVQLEGNLLHGLALGKDRTLGPVLVVLELGSGNLVLVDPVQAGLLGEV